MAVTGWKTPQTCATVDRDGGNAWLYPDNAKTSNDVWVFCALDKSEYEDWLRVTNFDFASDIPAGATIDGIEAKIERHGSAANKIQDSALYLRKTSGQVGDNKASAVFWPTSDAEATYGGAADTWDAGLVDADIRNSDFGLDLSVLNTDNANILNVNVDCISIRVYYTEAEGENHRRGSFFKMF